MHPECQYEVVEAADEVGSTEKIIQTIAAAPAGTAWAVGTELNLVRRLAGEFPDKRIVFLEKNVCYCSTMNRIDLPHLVWALESLVAGPGRQPDRGRPDGRALGPRGARPDARPARQDPQGLSVPAGSDRRRRSEPPGCRSARQRAQPLEQHRLGHADPLELAEVQALVGAVGARVGVLDAGDQDRGVGELLGERRR